MASEFHPVLSPRVADKPDETITLGFDDPDVATKVVVQIFEVDAWRSGPDRVVENAGRDTLIAELKGRILGKKFLLDSITPKGKTGAKPEMRLHIDGEDAPLVVDHSLPFPDSAIVNENGVFEVEARVSGLIGGKKRSGKTKVPVFLRNFKAGRPIVAFITGDTRSDPFFANADLFWKAVADGKFSLGSVEEIRTFLFKRADAGGFGPWGEVNVVNHGNEFEWIVKLFGSAKGVSHVHTQDLDKLRSDPRIFGPIPSLDDTSRVIIRGCAIGNDQSLLDAIRDVFGGDATILAPKFIQIYATSGKISREGFMEMFFFYVPGSSAPSLADCKQTLSQKFPDVKDDDWLPMLKRTTLSLDGYRHDRTENFAANQTFTVSHAPGKPAPTSLGKSHDFVQDVKEDWTNDEDHFHTDFDEWKWTAGPLRRKETSQTETVFVQQLVGSRHRVEVRRELRDKDGKPVRPDTNNPAHFGRSPAGTP
jgi:hypothetical protein